MIVGEHQDMPLTVEQKDIEYVNKFQTLEVTCRGLVMWIPTFHSQTTEFRVTL